MEDDIQDKILVSALGLAVALSSAASAATVSGRITYLDFSAHRLMLDNSDTYAVAPNIAPQGLEVGRLVTVDITNRGAEKAITKVEKFT
jgi:hypothetical protein